MRYLVRYFNGVDIINDISTNDYDIANKRAFDLKNNNPTYRVWIADAIMEILVG